jgi:hypothetical protein
MILTYYADNKDPQVFDFSPRLLETPDSEALESVGGDAWDTYEQFAELFFKGSLRARRAVLWIMLRKTDPHLRFQDVSFRTEQVTLGYSPAEEAMLLDAMLQNPDMDPAQREFLTNTIKTQPVADSEAALEEAGMPREPDLKEPSMSSDLGDLKSLMKDLPPDSENSTVGPWQN